MIALYIILSVILLIYLLLRCSLVFDIKLTPEETSLKVRYLFFDIYPKKEKVLTEKQKQRRDKKNKKKKAKLTEKLEKEKVRLKKKYAKAHKGKGSSSVNVKGQDVSFQDTLKKSDDSKNENTETADNKEEFSKSSNAQSENKTTADSKKKKTLKERFAVYLEKWEQIKPHIPAGKKAVRRFIKSIRIDDLYLRYLVTDEDAYECAMKYGKTNMVIYDALGVLSALVTVRIKKIDILTKFNCDETDYELSCKVKTRPSTLLAISVACLCRVIVVYFKQSRAENKKGDVVNERSSN